MGRSHRQADGAASEVGAPAGEVSIGVELLRRFKGRGEDLTLAAENLAESLVRIGDSTTTMSGAAGTAGDATARVFVEANAVAEAASQMSGAMQQVARSATQATEVTGEAGRVTVEVRASVERLAASTVAIDDVVRTVNAISDQTRLLALNATIEAARAGAAGKGFAVVAEEVKNLAAETNSATASITAQLAALAEDSTAVRAAVERIDEVLARMDGLQQAISVAVDQQTVAIAEITRSAANAAGAVGDLSAAVAVSSGAAESVDLAVARTRTWLARLEAAAWAQTEEFTVLGDGVEAHPLRAGVIAHTNWKSMLRTAVQTGRLPEGVDPAAVARDDGCPFGTWLRSEEASALDADRARSVIAQHAAFHREVAAVLAAVAQRRLEHARTMLHDPDGYAAVASDLTDSLLGWLRAVEPDDLSRSGDRRAYGRAAAEGEVSLQMETGLALRGILHDLSEGGLSCTVRGADRDDVVVGSFVRLALDGLRVDGRVADRVEAQAQVAWTRVVAPGCLDVGAEFVRLEPELRQRLGALAAGPGRPA